MDPSRPATMAAAWHTRLMGVIEEQPWLEPAQQAVTTAVQPLLDGAEQLGLKDWLHGVPIGHALHPILVDLPIGFWTSAFVLDLVGARRSARFLTAFGVASALGAAATGVADWSATDGREKRLGLVHGALNLAGTTCQVLALVSRRRFRRYAYAGYALNTAAAYIGGELVFGRGIMVDHDAWTAGPEKWTSAGPLEEIPEGGIRAVEIEGRKVLLHREGTRVDAMEDACPHLGGPLHEGQVEDGCVTCPWHGSQFRLSDGQVMRGPATFSVLRLETRIRAGRVEVRGRSG
jgi:nitrite reductase/ring-hydroxylating ferredoxin subunit